MRRGRAAGRLTGEAARRGLPLALACAVTVLAAALPFVVLVRACLLFESWSLPTAVVVFLGAAAASAALSLYACAASRRLHLRAAPYAATLVGAYCVYALVFVGPARGKDADVGAGYSELHPILRLAAGTVAVVDSEFIVTDAWRTPAFYPKVGLPPEPRSLHFRQADGYARALDVRTIGRGFLRNGLTALWFRALGLHTKRHVGTADHLHVSLPIPL
jgi:hypothetical protein